MARKPTQFTQSGAILDLAQIEQFKDQANRIWLPNPIQGEALSRLEYEIFIGGGKYSGKTEAGRIWCLSGNPHLPDINPDGTVNYINTSYIYHPHYKCVVLRRNQDDLDEWVDRFKEIARPFGANHTSRPDIFEFPSGAKVYCSHLKDESSYFKYQGQNIIRMLIEELTQIPDLKLFKMVRSCVRSIYPEMRAQMFLTANPGGPGHPWVYDRYIEPKDPKTGKVLVDPHTGKPFTPGSTIEEEVTHPFEPTRKIKITRVFIFATVKDNPQALADETYLANLATMDEKEQRAYLHGDWSAMSGTYFNFLKDTHTIPHGSKLLLPWWRRESAVDWGFVHDMAMLTAAEDPNTKQIHVYREIGGKGWGFDEAGMAWAKAHIDELNALPDHAMTIWFSHEKFNQADKGKTMVEMFGDGIRRVLGPRAVYLPELEIRRFEREVQEGIRAPIDPAVFSTWAESLLANRRAGVTIRVANNNRVIGWQELRRWLRHTPLITDDMKFDPDLALRIAREQGEERYAQYVQLFRELEQSREILPKLLIWAPVDDAFGCPRLIDAFPKAIHSDKNPEDVSQVHFDGMDYLDALRYLAMGFKTRHVPAPFDHVRDQRIFAAQTAAKLRGDTLTTSDLIHINRKIEADWAKKQEGEGAIMPVRMSQVWRYRNLAFAQRMADEGEWSAEDRGSRLGGGWVRPYGVNN